MPLLQVQNAVFGGKTRLAGHVQMSSAGGMQVQKRTLSLNV